MSSNFPNAYIYDLISDETLVEFQFLPTDARESKSADYAPHEIVGRSTPIFAYSGSDARKISLTLQFFASPFQDDDSFGLDEIMDTVNMLRSTVYPDYSDSIAPPHRLMLRLGNVMAMECIARSYELSMPSNGIWEMPGPTLAHYYAVHMSFDEVRAIPAGLDDVRGGDSADSSSPGDDTGYSSGFDGGGDDGTSGNGL